MLYIYMSISCWSIKTAWKFRLILYMFILTVAVCQVYYARHKKHYHAREERPVLSCLEWLLGLWAAYCLWPWVTEPSTYANRLSAQKMHQDCLRTVDQSIVMVFTMARQILPIHIVKVNLINIQCVGYLYQEDSVHTHRGFY